MRIIIKLEDLFSLTPWSVYSVRVYEIGIIDKSWLQAHYTYVEIDAYLVFLHARVRPILHALGKSMH